MKRLLAALAVLLALSGGAAAQDAALNVMATSNILADVARSVGGGLVTVEALIPPDADGHAWQPTPADVQKVAEADMVLAVGMGYETFLGGLVENASDVPQVIVSKGITALSFAGHGHDEGDDHAAEATADAQAEDEHAGEIEVIGVYGEEGVCEEGHAEDDDHAAEATAEAGQTDDHAEDEHAHGECDPHVWMNPANVMIWAENIAAAFAEADPANAETYRANAAAYIAQLEALDAEVAGIVAGVPEARRVLVTNHEFLGYFAHRYGFVVAGGILGATTLEEPDPQSLAALIEAVRALGVPAVFAEVSAQSPFAQVVADEAGLGVVTDLYSESLSSADGPASTYVDYLRYNATQIAAALSQ